MDVQMPEMDGFETTQIIRQRERGHGSHVPIIAMTAYALQGDRERCLAAGMDGYLSKPIRSKQLYETIESIRTDHPPVATTSADEDPTSAVNLTEALSSVGGDGELLRELAGVCLEECPLLLQQIRLGLAQRDAARLRLAAHTLKGSIASFGAPAAYAAALRLETLAQDGNLDEAAVAWATLEQEIRRFLPALTALTRSHMQEK
jgi:CheY-like chemotaxis protein